MSLRRTVLALILLVLPLVFGAAAAPPRGARRRPRAPTNLRITASTATSASLAWDAASSKSSNWWYCVQRDGQGCYRVDPPQTTWTFPNLWPGTFNWSVVAIDANGNVGAQQHVTYTRRGRSRPRRRRCRCGLADGIAVAWRVDRQHAGLLHLARRRGALSTASGLQPRPSPGRAETTHEFKVTVRDSSATRREQHPHGDDAR